ncbi:MAG TPA: alpha/beta hydrolase [Candidatus Polarisedimenticolia bacterium]|jgi:pimeloyl-ACP methyl ester carboxylesterase|nr:alpha/beta hydrolase [Candidatus Polarisedimenticolia bacterium]
MATDPGDRNKALKKIVLVLLIVIGVPVAGLLALIHAASQPATDHSRQDLSEMLLKYEDASFMTSDGVRLAAWFVFGRPGMPPIILCHDLGGSRSQLVNSAIALNKAGFPLLLLDFRRHGDSGAARSTFGMDERLDVQAAIAWLRGRRDVQAATLGGWGVGMGAYALTLAAIDEPGLKALALDGLAPSLVAAADRRVKALVPESLHALVPATRLLYDPYFRCRLGRFAVFDRLSGLGGRSLLLIAGSEEPEQFAEERRIYDAIPESADGDKNLLELRRSGMSGLYAEDRVKYDQAIRDFFTQHMSRAAPPEGALQVIEK